VTVRARHLVVTIAVAATAAASACGSGDEAAPAVVRDAGVDDVVIDAGESNVDAGPVRAPFGLDARPSNTTCLAPKRPPAVGAVKLERVFPPNMALGFMMGMAMAPGDPTHWYSASLDGYIYRFPVVNPSLNPEIVADLAADPTYPSIMSGESGLLGIAFHPKFAQNGRLYVSYGTSGGPPPGGIRSIVARLTSTDGGHTFGPPVPVIGPFDQPSGHHMGGGIAFGLDGFLYLSFGDGTDYNNGQRTDTFFSKVLRIDVDSPPAPGLAYAIPDGNPFENGGGEPATFARGFRNPYRLSIDRGTGDVWVGDVGDAAYEEVDLVKLGGNYGWPCREGAHDHPLMDDPVACPSYASVLDPAYDYDRGTIGSAAVTGGVVYRGKAMPWFAGSYVFGDYVSGEMRALTYDTTTGATKATLLNPAGPSGFWTSFSEDLDGEIYALDHVNGIIYKLVPNGTPAASAFPDRLSKTGCVDPSAPSLPSKAMIPFAPNAALWSDGADKDRWFAIPDGKTVHVGADGDFDFPIGSVLVKTFSLGGKRIETRLFVRHEDGDWAGYSYEWLDDQSDAVLLPADKSKTIAPGRTWSFPSRSGCMKCHTKAAGGTLGLELAQLDREILYPSTNRISNELATLDHIGLLDAPLASFGKIAAYPDPLGSAPVEGRARAYLHTNCSMCHRPNGGAGRAAFDLRFTTPLASSATCNALAKAGDLGITDARILAPGAPARSLLSRRPHLRNALGMPPLGSTIVDDKGIAVVDDWIRSIATCP